MPTYAPIVPNFVTYPNSDFRLSQWFGVDTHPAVVIFTAKEWAVINVSEEQPSTIFRF
jgi:hypothetical protein